MVYTPAAPVHGSRKSDIIFYSPDNQKTNREVRKLKHTSELEGVIIIKKLDDIPELKETLISIYETKSHKDVSRYSLLLAEHVLALSGMPRNETVESCFSVSRAWQEGTTKFQQARQVAFALHRLAREETNPVFVLVYRTLGQIAATPHVKRHALVASDYAVRLINRMYPNDRDKVREMRKKQIALMESV